MAKCLLLPAMANGQWQTGRPHLASFYHPYGIVANNKGEIFVADYQKQHYSKDHLLN